MTVSTPPYLSQLGNGQFKKLAILMGSGTSVRVSICISLMSIMLSVFSCAIGHLYIFLREMSFQILCPLLNWVICLYYYVVRVLYIFWKHVLYKIHDFKIFSPGNMACLLILLTVLPRAEVLILMKSNLSLFFFYGLYFAILS